jgi:hypothetical protein
VVALAHRLERAFEVAGKSLSVEQRRRWAVVREFRSNCRQLVRAAHKVDRHRLVLGLRASDHPRQTDRREHARGDTSGERFADSRQHQQASPQRIAGGGHGVERERVKEQVGEAGRAISDALCCRLP